MSRVICFTDSHDILPTWKNHFSQLLNVPGVNDVRQTNTHSRTTSTVPEPSVFVVELAIEKLKRQKLPRIDQIPEEIINAGGKTIRFEIHKHINSIWNEEKLPEEWRESIIVPIFKKGDKTDYSDYRGISVLPTTYKIISSILLSRLTPYAEEIIGDHQCGFLRNRSTNDHIFCIHQILEKNENTTQQCISFL